MTEQENALVDWLVTEPPMEEAVERYERICEETSIDNVNESVRMKCLIRSYIGNYTAILAEHRVFHIPYTDNDRRTMITYELTSAEEARAERANERHENAKYHKRIRCLVFALIFLVLLNLVFPFICK